jgi:hypothetical protein
LSIRYGCALGRPRSLKGRKMDTWTQNTSRRAVIGAAAIGLASGLETLAKPVQKHRDVATAHKNANGTSGLLHDFHVSVTEPPFNAAGDGIRNDTTAFNGAIAAVLARGGGVIVVPPGTYLVDEIEALPDSVSLIGCAMFEKDAHRCILKYRGTKACLRTTSRNIIENIRIEGPAINIPDYAGAAGTGIHLQGGYHRLENVWVWGFGCGLQIDEAYWCNYYGCVFTFNIRNIIFDSAAYSTTQMFIGCTVSLAKKEGLKGTSVPTRNIAIQFFGGSIESNVQDNSPIAQVTLGSVGNLMFNGTYFEDTKPVKSDTLDISLAGEVTFTNCYFNGAAKHIRSAVRASSHISIQACRFLGTSDPQWSVDLDGCENVFVFGNEADKEMRVTGAGSVTLDDGILVRGQRVVGRAASGWARDLGIPKRSANASYTAPRISKSPTQAEVQALANSLQDLSRTMKALKDDLFQGGGVHGLLGP